MKNILLLLLFSCSLHQGFGFTLMPDSTILHTEKVQKSKTRKRDLLVNTAKKYVGVPYKMGGCTSTGFDCSGFVQFVYKKYDVALPRTSKEQSRAGKRRWKRRPRKGDLLFFKGPKGFKVAHVGIVVSEKGEPVQFIHASTSRGVMVSSLETTYFKKRYKRARKFKSLKKKIK